MKAFLAVLVAAVAAASATSAGAAGPSNNGQVWSFECTSAPSEFLAVKTDSSSSSFHIILGATGNFLVKSIRVLPDGDWQTNKAYSGKSQNSSATIDCTASSPVAPFTSYEMIGVITPQTG